MLKQYIDKTLIFYLDDLSTPTATATLLDVGENFILVKKNTKPLYININKILAFEVLDKNN